MTPFQTRSLPQDLLAGGQPRAVARQRSRFFWRGCFWLALAAVLCLAAIAIPELIQRNALRELQRCGAEVGDEILVDERLPAWINDRLPKSEQSKWFVRVTGARFSRLEPPQIFHAAVERLDAFPGLTRFEVHSGPIRRRDVQKIAKIASLRELVLTGVDLDGRAFVALSQWERLERLTFSGCSGLRHLKPLVNGPPRLQSLQVLNDNDGSLDFAALGQMERLRELSLDRSRLAKARMASLSGLTSLRSLVLQCDDLEGGLASVPTLPSLERLTLKVGSLDDAQLDELRRFPHVEFLSLDSSHLTLACLPRLRDLPRLQEAVLPGGPPGTIPDVRVFGTGPASLSTPRGAITLRVQRRDPSF